MDEATFSQWLSEYGRAWQSGDADAAAALFTPDAVYHETPFHTPMAGRDAIHGYWLEGASTTQTQVNFAYNVLAVRENVGIAHWTARFTRVPSGSRVRLDGVLVAVFADGLCAEFREWWHRAETAAGPI